MKFCVHLAQDEAVAAKAAWLKLDVREIEHCFADPKVNLLDAIEKYPEAEFIVQVPHDEVPDWDKLDELNKASNNRIIVCVARATQFVEAKARNIRYYLGFPVNNFYDVHALKELGVCAIKVESPIFFQMDTLKKFGVPIIVEANTADFSIVPKPFSWCGSWIRPEDVETYEGFVDVITFSAENLVQEATLFKYYAEKHEWEGKLDALVHDLVEENVHNWLINPEQMRERLNCKQRCQNGGSCNICSFNFKMAQKGDQIEEFINRLKKSKEENNSGEGSAE